MGQVDDRGTIELTFLDEEKRFALGLTGEQAEGVGARRGDVGRTAVNDCTKKWKSL